MDTDKLEKRILKLEIENRDLIRNLSGLACQLNKYFGELNREEHLGGGKYERLYFSSELHFHWSPTPDPD